MLPVFLTLGVALTAVSTAFALVIGLHEPIRAGLALAALELAAMATTDLLFAGFFWIKRRFFP